MLRPYTLAEARANLSEILDSIQRGDAIQITRRGIPAAVVMSTSRYEMLTEERNAFGRVYDAFCAEHDLAANGLEPGWFDWLRDGSKRREQP